MPTGERELVDGDLVEQPPVRDPGEEVAARQGLLAGQRALQIDPAFVAALLNLASLRTNAGEPKAGEEIYRRALALAPRSYEAYNGLGIALARQGRTREAAEAFEKAIAIDPGLATARENLRALESR